MHSQTHFSSVSSGSGHYFNAYSNDPTPDEPTYNPERNTEQDKIHNHSQDLKLILDYYYKNQKFGGGVDDDCLRHLPQFHGLEEEYESDSDTRRTNFIYSLKPSNQEYHYCQQL